MLTICKGFPGAAETSGASTRRTSLPVAVHLCLGQREVEGCALALDALRPDGCRREPGRCAWRWPGQGRFRRPSAPGRPCRSARRSASGLPAAMPTPVSATETVTISPSLAETVIAPPGGVNLMALCSRLLMTCCSRSLSASTGGRSGRSTLIAARRALPGAQALNGQE